MISTCASTVPVCVTEPSHVGEARRLGVAMAGSLGFSAAEAGKVSIAVTEAATNLIKHAQHGELLFRCIERERVAGIEMISLDKGPGMADVQRCMEDGYSTAGSPGTGLGALARQSAFLDIYSQPGSGTAIVARFWSRPVPGRGSSRVLVGGVSVPVTGEQLCGDSWAVAEMPDRTVLLVADGLGHGQFASEAADEAVRVFGENAHESPTHIIEYVHGALRGTRGAAVVVAEINLATNFIQFVGVGNIAATIINHGASRGMISHNGIVGHEMRKVQELTYPWPPGGLMVISSDGLQTRWSLDRYPRLIERDPTVIAGVLYRDFKRERDDVTVVVCKSIVPVSP